MKTADFKPGKESYAIGSGVAVPVWPDFFMQNRPQGGIHQDGLMFEVI